MRQRATGGALPSGPQLATFPMPGLAAGENLLVVPSGTRLQAYRIGAEP